MKTRTYAVLVTVAFCAILLNALYGHNLYGSPYDQALAKYSIYVHLQPGWDSAPANILYDVTVSWDGSPKEGDSYNSNQILTQGGREVVVLQHGFSDCSHGWSPPLYRYGADVLRSYIDYVGGRQLNLDPYTPHLPDIPNTTYSDQLQASLIPHGYAHFIPVCNNGDAASFQYSISINDPDVAFDAYFVPSSQVFDDFLRGDDLVWYANCFVTHHISHTGFCNDVGPDSGLLVILPDMLEQSLTRVSVSILQTTSSLGA